MNQDRSETEKVKAVIESYIEGSRTGNVSLLKDIFHPKAIMSGFLQGQTDIGTPDPFFEAVEKNPASQQSEKSYIAEITFLEVTGSVASVVLKEKGFLGLNFTNFFHLLKEEGKWSIISKTFTQE
ncbi:nuclear transport factor 2 family protein [bacterium]|nr:nuclear transport factor 2 family protein [bacterium]